MYRLQRARYDLFDDLFDGFFNTSPTTLLKTDIKETDTHYQILIDVPGVEKDNINITLEKGYLCVTANKTTETKDDQEYFLKRERSQASATRKFYVGNYLTEDNIKAELDKGVLTLEVPKETEKPDIKKRIEIK